MSIDMPILKKNISLDNKYVMKTDKPPSGILGNWHGSNTFYFLNVPQNNNLGEIQPYFSLSGKNYLG